MFLSLKTLYRKRTVIWPFTTQLYGLYHKSHKRQYPTKIEIEEQIFNGEVNSFFKDKSKDEINDILKFIKFNIYHMAPILLYVNDKTFSTFYNYNNLIKEFDGDTDEFY